MNEKDKKRTSKFLSLVLRHSPEAIGLKLDENGWADIDELIIQSAKHNQPFSRDELREIVTTNDKQRFAFNDCETRIRASQGHSVEIELNLVPVAPPAYLYHGTVEKFLIPIREEGLKKMQRQHVHLSKDKETAEKVGNRRGEAIILTIDTAAMERGGYLFYLSANGVWLTDIVPAKYIDFTNANA